MSRYKLDSCSDCKQAIGDNQMAYSVKSRINYIRAADRPGFAYNYCENCYAVFIKRESKRIQALEDRV